MELRAAAGSGAPGEVVALLRLSLPELPVVFGAVSLGCPATLQAVLDHGEDPDETYGGLSPLSFCVMIATAAPLQPLEGVPRRPNLTLDTALEIVRALLSAGATPSTEDLWMACYLPDSALGELLLASACGPQLVSGVGSLGRPLLSIAGIHCPALVYPLLERGASLREFGPDGVLPVKMDIAVFQDARWKLLRMLYLLHRRGCVAIPMHLVRVIGAFLTEPLSLKAGGSARASAAPPQEAFAFFTEPLEMSSMRDTRVPPSFLVAPPPLPLFPA
jgi:hypothetical protein